jgi:transposase
MTWQPKQLTSVQLQERRLTAADLLQQGELSQAQIARHLNVSRAAVRKWNKRLQESSGDWSCLYSRARKGRPARLTSQQWQQLLDMLRDGAQAVGFADERWTLERVRFLIRLIRREWDVAYHACYLSRRLHALGWSVQKPAVVARERDEELVGAWLRQDWPRIKTGASARRHDPLRG